MYLDDILLHNLKAIMHLCGKPDRHVSSRNRIARIIKSSYLPERDALFTINEQGITDPKE
jgi:hypothetical protein